MCADLGERTPISVRVEILRHFQHWPQSNIYGIFCMATYGPVNAQLLQKDCHLVLNGEQKKSLMLTEPEVEVSNISMPLIFASCQLRVIVIGGGGRGDEEGGNGGG